MDVVRLDDGFWLTLCLKTSFDRKMGSILYRDMIDESRRYMFCITPQLGGVWFQSSFVSEIMGRHYSVI